MKHVKVFNVQYDTDGETLTGLPSAFVFDVEANFDIDILAELVCQETGWLVKSLEYKYI